MLGHDWIQWEKTKQLSEAFIIQEDKWSPLWGVGIWALIYVEGKNKVWEYEEGHFQPEMSQCKAPGVGICEACSGNSERAGLVSEHQRRGKWWPMRLKRKYKVDQTGLSALNFFPQVWWEAFGGSCFGKWLDLINLWRERTQKGARGKAGSTAKRLVQESRGTD